MTISEKLIQIAENQQKVYQAGYDEGVQASDQEGLYDQGFNDAQNQFWDTYQANGTRTNYNHAFAGRGWTQEMINPKYPLSPNSSTRISAYMLVRDNTKVTDLSSICPLYINNGQYAFSTASNLKHIGKVGLYYSAYGAFASCTNLSVIDELTIPSGVLGSASAAAPWPSCPNLTYMKFVDSTLDQSINLSSAISETTITVPADIIDDEGNVITAAGTQITEKGLLYNPTLTSLINSLKDYSGTTTTRTLTLGDINKAKLSEEDIATITQKGWTLA